MALDLSVKSHGSESSDVNKILREHSRMEIEDNNNNSVSAMNLTVPKLRDEENLEKNMVSSPPQLSPQQIQLDIAALNLLCLARLQETAAVLTGRRPLPAHMNSSSFPLVTNSNRRNHKCDEPGCDKVRVRVS